MALLYTSVVEATLPLSKVQVCLLVGTCTSASFSTISSSIALGLQIWLPLKVSDEYFQPCCILMFAIKAHALTPREDTQLC